MPDGAQQSGVLEAVRPRDAQADNGLAASRDRHVAGVSREIARIMALAEAGCFYEGREACAGLMFEFQPVLVAHPALLQRFSMALRRCNAEQLLRRLSLAVHGEAV